MAFDLASAKPVNPSQPSGGFDLSTAQPVSEASNNSNFAPGSLGSRAEDVASGANRFFTTILPGLPVDTVMNVVDLLKAGAGTAYHAATGNPIPSALELTDRTKVPLSSANIQQNLEKYAPTLAENNRPVNEDATGRVLHNVGIGAGGAIAGTGMSGASIPAAANNVALSVAPSIAQGVVAEKYPDSPILQLAASIGTSALQSGVRYGVPELTKRMLRGGEEGRQNAQATIAQFGQAGEVPTVGQATQSRTYRAAENLLSRVPGGAGPIITKAENLSTNLGNKVNEIADSLSPSATPEQAGRAIYKGITGDHMKDPSQAFIPKARAVQQALYQKLDNYIDPASEVPVSNTLAALNKLTSPIPGAPNLSETPLMSNATLNTVKGAISADLGYVNGKYVADPRGPISYKTVPQGEAQTVGTMSADPRGPVTYRGVNNSPPVESNLFSPSVVRGTVADSNAGDIVTTAGQRYSESTVNPVGSNVTAAGSRYVQPGGMSNGITSTFAPKEVLPYRAIKEMRTRIGEKIADTDLSPDVSKNQLRSLYAALSKDMEQAATDAGPQALAAFKRANGYTSAMHDRIDLLQSVIDKNGGPEKIFNAATSGTKDGATVLRTVMRSLPEDGKKMLSASILRRMGKALPGHQDANGDVFSTNRFLTQWNTMSPEAKAAAFGGYSKDFGKNMDALAGVSANLREGSKVFANPSGTAQAVSQQTAALGILGALATGHVVTAAAGVGGIGAANLAARALTSPRIVKWMVKTTQLPKAQFQNQVRILALTGQREKDQDMIDVAAALQKQGNQPDNASANEN